MLYRYWGPCGLQYSIIGRLLIFIFSAQILSLLYCCRALVLLHNCQKMTIHSFGDPEELKNKYWNAASSRKKYSAWAAGGGSGSSCSALFVLAFHLNYLFKTFVILHHLHQKCSSFLKMKIWFVTWLLQWFSQNHLQYVIDFSTYRLQHLGVL